MDNNNDKNTTGKGIAESTVDAVKKIMKVKKIAITIGTISPVLGVVCLIILSAVLVFLPIISTYSFTGGIFNSSTSNKEDLLMRMNLEGFDKEDVKIFQDFSDGKEQYKNLKFKKDDKEQIDLSLLISTIQNQGLVNFEDNGSSFDMNSEINKSEERIKNFESLDDFNKYIDKYGSASKNQEQIDYNGESIVDNKQNKAFYNNLKDKGGQVYYIYPGTRKLLGYMIANEITYDYVEYERWICDGKWCDNAAEIWSDWGILQSITSNNGTNANCGNSGSAWGAICNIRQASSYANSFLSSADPNSWEYKNVKYDLQQLENEVLSGESSSSDIAETIKSLAGGDSRIPDGNFSVGVNYVTVSVKKYMDYDLYENYAEDVFIKHLYLDCDNCSMKDTSDDLKKKEASNIYNNIYSVKELFDYFNDETDINGTSISGTSGIGGTGTIKGVTYECGTNYVSVSTDYCSTPGCRAHNANDISIAGSLTSPNIYPIMEGEVVVVNNSCNSICPSSEANRYIAGASLSSLSSACSCGGGFGNYVRIKSTYNGKTIYATYAHLSSVNVSVGETVTYNTILGVMGTTGVSTGRHLHLELSYNSDYSNKFPATVLFTTDTVRGTTCSRNISSEEQV